MDAQFKKILIIADIEGSSGCWSRRGSAWLTAQWREACVEMTRDVNAVVKTLFSAGAASVRVKDFHRTGYNLLAGRIDSRARMMQGYLRGPVPGLGDPGDSQAVMFLGMHAAAGTSGFLAHTLTSRIARLEVNGRPLAEVELFAASLAPFGLRPIFFSGCPVACEQARAAINGIRLYPIDKIGGPHGFDAAAWRSGLARAAAASLNNHLSRPYQPAGPFRAVIKMRDGSQAAQNLAGRWGFEHNGDQIFINSVDIHTLYMQLIRLCYLSPLIERMLPAGLWVYNLWGRLGLFRVRRS